MNQAGIDRFGDGVQALLLGHPFFGSLLMKMKHEPMENCPTLFVDGRRIGYGPDFMAQQDIEQATFCVGHEVMHAAWMHNDRIRHYLQTGIGPDGQPLDVQLFGQALDYPINSAMLAEGKNIGKYPAGITICLDPKYTSAWTPEEVYCDLKKNGQPQSGSGGGKPGAGDPQQFDEHAPSPENATDVITAADVQQAVNVAKAMRGDLPAGIDRLIDQIKKPEHSPWDRLRRAVLTTLSGYDASSWRRLNRRMIVRGVGMPGRVAQGAGTIGIVVDTSMSIYDAILQLFGGHLGAIIDQAKPKKVRIYWTDAKVHRVDEARNGADLRKILSSKIPGGGGTDMRKGVVASEIDKNDLTVVLTDGETPFCEGKRKVIWAITNKSLHSPYGETIHIR